jgi:hypothetical protein
VLPPEPPHELLLAAQEPPLLLPLELLFTALELPLLLPPELLLLELPLLSPDEAPPSVPDSFTGWPHATNATTENPSKIFRIRVQRTRARPRSN